MVLRPRHGRFRPARHALAALPLALLTLAAPARATATTAGDLRTCTNQAWSAYNACLVDSSTEWERTGCDVAFSSDYALCWAKYIGVIKEILT